MSRLGLVLAALALAAGAGVQLARDTRAVLRGNRPVAEILAQHAVGRERVLIVFQPEDCLGDGTLIQRWNALAAAPGVRASGLLIGAERIAPAQQRRLDQAGLRMRLASIPALDAELVAGMLGHTRTPFAIVLDPHGRVAGSFPAGQNVPPEVIARLAAGS